MRKDARLRRERLLRAAMELFASEGVDVPLEKVAERAGVGRGTLYRNFPDRLALTIAVQDALLEDLGRRIGAWADRDDAFVRALRELASFALATGGLEKIIPLQRQSPETTGRFRAGVEALLAEPLARAKRAGVVRQDFPLSQAHQAAMMLAAGAIDSRPSDAEANMDHALDLLVRGLRPGAA